MPAPDEKDDSPPAQSRALELRPIVATAADAVDETGEEVAAAKGARPKLDWTAEQDSAIVKGVATFDCPFKREGKTAVGWTAVATSVGRNVSTVKNRFFSHLRPSLAADQPEHAAVQRTAGAKEAVESAAAQNEQAYVASARKRARQAAINQAEATGKAAAEAQAQLAAAATSAPTFVAKLRRLATGDVFASCACALNVASLADALHEAGATSDELASARGVTGIAADLVAHIAERLALLEAQAELEGAAGSGAATFIAVLRRQNPVFFASIDASSLVARLCAAGVASKELAATDLVEGAAALQSHIAECIAVVEEQAEVMGGMSDTPEDTPMRGLLSGLGPPSWPQALRTILMVAMPAVVSELGYDCWGTSDSDPGQGELTMLRSRLQQHAPRWLASMGNLSDLIVAAGKNAHQGGAVFAHCSSDSNEQRKRRAISRLLCLVAVLMSSLYIFGKCAVFGLWDAELYLDGLRNIEGEPTEGGSHKRRNDEVRRGPQQGVGVIGRMGQNRKFCAHAARSHPTQACPRECSALPPARSCNHLGGGLQHLHLRDPARALVRRLRRRCIEPELLQARMRRSAAPRNACASRSPHCECA